MQSIFPYILFFALSLVAKVIFAENTTNPGKFSEIKTKKPVRRWGLNQLILIFKDQILSYIFISIKNGFLA